MNKKITKIIKEEIENFEKEDSIEMPEKTDPTKGVVAPSKKVLSDVCEKEKFCKKQGPITFGQLRSLVESAQRKNLIFDVGEGGYKATLRLLPWFFPQIAVAGFIGSSVRAFNKIIRPGLEDTRGYKRWWGKTIIKVMDVFEGDIPRQDPISKIFFISDGLLHMMDKKFKLKFARYIAELAASKPDSEPVPEYFVENELRKWINQKFLLNPPLQPKTMNESEDDFDWIRETRPVSYEFLIGKALEFEPTIKDGDTLMSILNFLSNLGFEYGDWYLDMEWNYGEYTEIFGLYLNPNGRIIYTTDLWDEDYQYHINDYAQTDVEVLDGWDTLSDYINRGTITESEDEFDWIREVPSNISIENPPKEGDVLICLPGFVNNDNEKNGGGAGYAEGRIVVVSSVEILNNPVREGMEIIVWPDEEESHKYWDVSRMDCPDCGIYDRALTYY